MWVFEEMVGGRKLTDIINEDHENVKYGTRCPPLGAFCLCRPCLPLPRLRALLPCTPAANQPESALVCRRPLSGAWWPPFCAHR